MRKWMLVVVGVVAGAGAFAAISLGEEGSTPSRDLGRAFERVAVHRTDAPSASASAVASASKKPKVKYFESDPMAVPVDGAFPFIKCPSKHKAISGYFLTTGGITLDASLVGGKKAREWSFGLLNLTGAPGEAIIGAVCGKNL